MPLPVITGVWRCAINWVASDGQTAENVIHVHNNIDGASTVADNIGSTVHSGQFDPVSALYTAPTVTITKLDGTSASEEFDLANWVGVGGQAVPQVAGLVSVYTGLRGRSNRGRIYLPGACEDNMADGFWADDIVAATQAAWGEWWAALASGSNTLFGVASYKNSTFEEVTSTVFRRATATQRKRQKRNQ